MASLWVIITGLGALVGDKVEDPDSAHTLLLQPVPYGSEVLGVEIAQHETRMRLVANGGADINVEYEAIVLPGSEAPAELANGGLLLPIGEELNPPALKVRPDVFRTRSATIMEFTGGFLWPIEVQKSFDLTSFSLNVRLPLKAAYHIRSGNWINKNRYVANGLLYRKPLDSQEAPVVRVRGEKYMPSLVPSGQTGNLPVVGSEDNYVLWIFNTGDDRFPPEEFDRDFYLLYDWLVDREVPRYVPVIDPPFNPPGQCMFSYAIS